MALSPGIKKIYRKRGRFWASTADYTGGREPRLTNLFPKQGDTNEIRSNFGADAQCMPRNRLCTTDPLKRKDVVFWKWWAQLDRSKATQLKQRRRECCWERYTGPVHVSRCQ